MARIGRSRGVQASSSLGPSRQFRRVAAHTICPPSSRSLVPHTESLALVEALGREGNVRLEIIHLFRHVQPELRDLTFGTIVKVYPPEGRKIYRLIFDPLRRWR